MITITNLIDNNLFISLSETVNHHDYEHTLVPAINDLLAQHDKINIAILFTDEFKGITLNALIDDAQLGIKHWAHWHKIALMNEPAWLHAAISALEAIAPFTFDFHHDELAAKLWFQEEDYF